jgi:hypothetical protein
MRFFEFKLPEPGSTFDAELKQHLLTLVNDAKKLPEADPKRIQFNQFLQNIKAEAGITEDPVAEVNLEMVNSILSFLAKKGSKEATMYLMDGAKILGDKGVQAALQKNAEVHTELGKEQVKAASTEKLTKAKSLSKKIGKDDEWGVTLHNALSYYENDQLHTDFLDLCLENQGLTQTINNPSQPFRKLNLKTIINPKLSELFANQQAFNKLALLPLSTGTGQGSGIGPGEALFACLTPNAKKAGKSDLTIDGPENVWEVKGGKSQESTGWLDASGAKATDLRRAFLSQVDPILRSKGRKTMKFKDGTVTTINDLIDNADFRPEKFRELKSVFKLLTPEEQIATIDALYAVIAPTLKSNPDSKKMYNRYVKDTVKLIANITNRSELEPINKLQAKLSMIEYAVGPYQAKNFLIYNYVTQDMVVIQGIDGIAESIDSSESNLMTTAITMRGKGADKGSPGIAIKTRDVRTRTRNFD